MIPKEFCFRLREERERTGQTQAGLAEELGVSKQTVQNWEGAGGKNTAIPGDKLEGCVKLGMDVQYIITGVRSANLERVAEEAGTYNNKEPQGARGLSREEEVLVQIFRQLKPSDRTRAQAVVSAFASTVKKTKKIG